jgi:hypothetical protein
VILLPEEKGTHAAVHAALAHRHNPRGAASAAGGFIDAELLTDAAAAATFFGTRDVGADAIAAVAHYRADSKACTLPAPAAAVVALLPPPPAATAADRRCMALIWLALLQAAQARLIMLQQQLKMKCKKAVSGSSGGEDNNNNKCCRLAQWTRTQCSTVIWTTKTTSTFAATPSCPRAPDTSSARPARHRVPRRRQRRRPQQRHRPPVPLLPAALHPRRARPAALLAAWSADSSYNDRFLRVDDLVPDDVSTQDKASS